jgi:hypothetical protein
MSIVSEFKLSLQNDEAGQIIAYGVSNSPTAAIVAVAVNTKVVFFGDNGQLMEYKIVA